MTWREKIIQNIKDCGQSLIDDAEVIAGGVHYQRGMTITCHVDEMDEPPYITVEVSYYPKDYIERNNQIMKSDCYFDECKDCLYKEYADNLCCCAASRLGLAWHRLIKELPLINKFSDNYKYCNWYQKEECKL